MSVSKRLPAEERRAQLLSAAIELSEESGLGALTIRAVAERAGVSLGVVHYCFVDKEELVNVVIDSVNEEIAGATRAFLSLDFNTGETGPEALRDRLNEALALIWAVIEATPQRQLLTYEIATYALRHERPEMQDLARVQYQGYDMLAESVLQRCGEASRMTWSDWPAAVRMVGAIIDAVSLRCLVDRDTEAAHRTLEIGVEMIVAIAKDAA